MITIKKEYLKRGIATEILDCANVLIHFFYPARHGT